MNDIFLVAAFYRFVSLPEFESMKPKLLDKMVNLGIKGTVLLAHEGINGTVAGTEEAIHDLIDYFNQDKRLYQMTYKFSENDFQPFYRSKVKLKKEIVKLGQADIDPNDIVGTYVSPEEWNDLIQQPDVVVVDTRNQYEVAIGTFKNAVDPKTDVFSQLPEYVEKQLDPKKHKKVAMFCTGGIRCEKSTAYMKQQGFEEVYHLEGGILNYLEKTEEKDSLWEGECFVFDDRVSVDGQLNRGSYHVCHNCDQIIKTGDGTRVHRANKPDKQCDNCAEGRNRDSEQ